MKILVVGGGGREHALVWKIAQSSRVSHVWCAPGNPGIARHAECVPIAATDIDALLEFALEQDVDLTVVGPEAPLTLGIVDRFRSAGLTIFGPSRAAARLEGSKGFSKDLMAKYGIPTAAYRRFTDRDEAVAYIRNQGAPIVVKADGLAAGKGVVVAASIDEAVAAVDNMMIAGAFGEAGAEVVIEEFMEGEEASFFVFTDGKNILPLASAQDHKQIFDGDQGPNTGGMGAYSPAPVVTPELYEKIVNKIVRPTISGMEREGCPYAGIIYIGLMIVKGKPKVIEYNARFGDPEAQPLLVRLKSDIVPVLLGCARGEMRQSELEWHDKAAVCVVMASGGYPGDTQTGFPISGLDDAEKIDDLIVFHAGTASKDGQVINKGGRVLGVTGLGKTVAQAIDKAYQGVKVISWEGAQYRSDIGRKALNRDN
ncbi:phosphoribosylamine--glycine ligase [Geoalkalibacter ferrihydriticus]|uniref:Phosphoribosylamine--glycine ligase n=2 Tax=Geoalkalibacter ferrihydriticus TaxID=392333 RepID=A0A0C2HLF9_9BACT|nr:phosphoribosylamine--glycine ligase [Geoalkalibacter ferrihydriticus]KIH77921.1 phosphoribosylamine--glycine ligase [Geoalkalibacter ferrihydriticus DSM 17813]SDM37287.1 phosphoribosylamine--glycine ligase [Geoalkalibacter ferrihydriticus]